MQKSILLLAFVCALVCLSGGSVFGLQYFDSSHCYYVDSYPYGIAAADFNGDNDTDIVTCNYVANSVSVLIGHGDGTFANRVNYPTSPSQYPYYVTTGDMDGDGNVDIVTSGSLGIVIFYGVGDGTFGTAQVYNFGQAATDVVVADFNNDTHLDIATSHAVRDSVGIHINNNDSTYTTHFVHTGNGTGSLAVGKLDSDNYTDILVGCSDGTVWNLKNNQAGDFTAAEVHLGILSDPASVAIADLNGDGIGDFAIVHAVNDYLYTYLNNGDGTYTIDKAYTLTDNPINVAFDDVNEDGEPDIFACIGTTSEIELYLNQGSGTFSFDSAYSIGGAPKDLVFADFNNDGHADLAATSNNTDQAGVLLSRMSLILSVDDVTNEGNLPIRFALGQNYPNPFNPETHIRFSLPEASRVKVEVFNTLGQSVMVLVDEYLSAGEKEITWNGVDASGQKVASGVYLYRLTTKQFTDSKSMVLLK
jgi:hypothetical protein